MSNDANLIYFNGINASTGTYGREPMTVEALARLITGDDPSVAVLEPEAEQRAMLQARATQVGSFGTIEGVREDRLEEAGWAVVFPARGDYDAIYEALSPLLALRKTQAGAFYRECRGPEGYRPGESARAFLERMGAATSGAVDPKRFPYYVLLIGTPEAIPFRFQYHLDVQYAVGRLDLPNPAAYANYAQGVVRAERGDVQRPRRVVFFAPANPDDPATHASANELVLPLHASLVNEQRAKDDSWQFETVLGTEAKKARLGQLLGGPATPALLFTASHGAEFDPLDPRMVAHQGALICQDWLGPREAGHRALRPDVYFASDDLGESAQVSGLIAFHFACFGAGTPKLDDFPQRAGVQRQIAPHPFVAGLPQRLLGHPGGGALAVIGHVERAWTYSFRDSYGARSVETFASMLRRVLLAGAPVGWALEFFNQRYAELATDLTRQIEDLEFGGPIQPYQLTASWTEHNDARSYVVLGDPAVRLSLQGQAPRVAHDAVIPEVKMSESSGPSPVASPTPAVAPTVASPTPAVAPVASFTLPQGYPAPPSVVINYNFAAPTASPAPSAAPPPPTQPGYRPPPPGSAEVESFGVRQWLSGAGQSTNEALGKLGESMREFAEQLATKLQGTLHNASNLEVATYVAETVDEAAFRDGDFSQASLRAFTSMSLDGDTRVIVPMNDMGVDQELWAVHTAMVAQAQTNRTEMIKALAQIAAGLTGTLK
ncbi:MAG: hypothetical protein AB4911_14050 [Oscillochloridaceae bacterium umkhey_bin13]